MIVFYMQLKQVFVIRLTKKCYEYKRFIDCNIANETI